VKIEKRGSRNPARGSSTVYQESLFPFHNPGPPCLKIVASRSSGVPVFPARSPADVRYQPSLDIVGRPPPLSPPPPPSVFPAFPTFPPCFFPAFFSTFLFYVPLHPGAGGAKDGARLRPRDPSQQTGGPPSFLPRTRPPKIPPLIFGKPLNSSSARLLIPSKTKRPRPGPPPATLKNVLWPAWPDPLLFFLNFLLTRPKSPRSPAEKFWPIFGGPPRFGEAVPKKHAVLGMAGAAPGIPPGGTFPRGGIPRNTVRGPNCFSLSTGAPGAAARGLGRKGG